MPKPELEPGRTDGATSGRWMVVIYNNDTNSVDEVVSILLRATGCTVREAEIEMWEAHTFGKAPVHFAAREECDKVARIIETIGVETTVEPEWKD